MGKTFEDYFSEIQTDMVALRKLCEEHQREMPTQIKLIYDVAANSLNADYSYDIIYSNHKNKMADDILEEWFESEKNKEKRGRSLWRKKKERQKDSRRERSN